MSGSLVQHASTGAQSNVLIDNREFSPFKTHVRRMTAFAMEPKQILFNGQTEFGKTAIASLTRQADLLAELYLVFEFKPVTTRNADGTEKYRCVNDVARAVLSQITLEAGSVVYQTLEPEWMHMWESITKKQDEIHEAMTGRVANVPNGLPEPLTDLAYKHNRFYVPLNFFFARTIGHSLPIIACHLTDIQVKVKLRQKAEVIRTLADSSMGAGLTENDFKIDHMYLMGEYIYLSDTERKDVAQKPHVFLIEQTQVERFTIPTGATSYKAELQFNHPVKAFYWYGLKKANQEKGDIFTWYGDERDDSEHYTSTNDLFKTCSISLNSNVRVAEQGPKYYSLLQTRRHHTNHCHSNSIYMYSFALYPEAVQPSGHLNCSRIEKIHMNFKFGTPIGVADGKSTELSVWAQCYNIVRIKGGMTSLAWAS